MDEKVRSLLISYMKFLDLSVACLSDLYTQHPELNTEVNIADIIPMSLDEWGVQISAKVFELENY